MSIHLPGLNIMKRQKVECREKNLIPSKRGGKGGEAIEAIMNNNTNQVDLVPFSRLRSSSYGSGC